MGKIGHAALALTFSFAFLGSVESSVLAQNAAQSTTQAIERDVVEVNAPPGIKVSAVRIDNRLGNVSIIGHDSESIKIQSFKRANDAQTLERLVVSLIPDAQGRVNISTRLRAGSEAKPVAAGSIAVDLIVFVPRHARVNAKLWRGDLSVKRVDRGAHLQVDQGSIGVEQVSGEVISEIRAGSQEFREVFGSINSAGVEGQVLLHIVEGTKLRASLVRGNIVGKKIKVKSMNLQAVFGNVDVVAELISGGHYRVTSRRGDVNLRFTGDAAVILSVSANSQSLPQSASAVHKRGKLVVGQWRLEASGTRPKAAGRAPAQVDVQANAGAAIVTAF